MAWKKMDASISAVVTRYAKKTLAINSVSPVNCPPVNFLFNLFEHLYIMNIGFLKKNCLNHFFSILVEFVRFLHKLNG